MQPENCQDLDTTSESSRYWADVAADKILAEYPNKESFTLATGVSPSGIVHLGHVRETLTTYAVAKTLQKRGKIVRIIFSWDDFDRFRKVPANLPAEFQVYIGAPLSSIPDPLGEYPSYSERFETKFEQTAAELGIEVEFIRETEQYQQGAYDNLITHALQKRREIGQILYNAMSDKAKSEKEIKEEEYLADYYPVRIYSRFTGKDSTEILSYDGQYGITYRCVETDKTETIDLRKDHIAKLGWKIDWPMRWKFFDVVFEPGGLDHATPGSSYDSSSKIAEKIFEHKAPQFIGYQFVGIRGLGSKMSSSKGDAVSPGTLLDIYEPHLLKWLYLRRDPGQSFSFAFDNEVYRQYDEIDQETIEFFAGTLSENRKSALELSLSKNGQELKENPIPFRQAVGLGQIVQWDEQKMLHLLEATGETFNQDSVRTRLQKAKAWLETYNMDQAVVLRDIVNTEYASTLTDSAKSNVAKLAEQLRGESKPIEVLDTLVYDIPKKPNNSEKENAKLQKAFFKDVYNLLISRDAGPRLSTFLWAVSREKVLKLLGL